MKRRNILGVTLIEMLLVGAIIASIIVMTIGYLQQRTFQLRIDRASSQMQQILNAGLSYYVNNSTWPANLQCLKGFGGATCTVRYLPPNTLSPWGLDYEVRPSAGSPSPLLNVYGLVRGGSGVAYAAATTLAGRLPLAWTSTSLSPDPNNPCTPVSIACWVVASVNIPGQNLNNASAVNFAGVYHNGACVPVPTCPVDAGGQTMNAQIVVAPISVSGINDDPNPGAGSGSGSSTCSSTNLSGCKPSFYPISSFTAYATDPDDPPLSCAAASGGTGVSEPCYTDSTNTTKVEPTTGQFWRVCLSTVTEKGVVDPQTNPWGRLQGTIMAMTRCVPKGEETRSSGFTVWSDK